MNPALGNLVLVGFMGTGKSAVGRILAARMGRTFVDMDATIETRTGKTISTIFAADGEPYFRTLERALASELATQTGLVIASGGGLVLNPQNIRELSRTGTVICLTATPEAILARLAGAQNQPLLAGTERERRVRDLVEQRRPFYEAIPLQVDTTHLTPDAVADAILHLLDRGT